MSNRHIKDLFSQTTIYGVGLLANKTISFILLPLYTYYFSPAELGAYNIVQSIWLFVILFYLYGQETSFIKLFIDGKNEGDKEEVYSTTLIMLSVTSLIFSSVFFFLAEPISRLVHFEDPVKGVKYLKILSVLLFTDTMFRFPLLLLRAELKANKYLLLTLLSLAVNVLLNFVLILKYNYGVEAIFYSYIASVVVTFAAGILMTRKYFGFKFSYERAKQMVKYGNKFIFIGAFILLIDVSDRFFLKYFYNEEVVGIYSANYRLASVMSLLIAAFRFSWTPYFLNLEKNPENKKIISQIFTYLVFAGLFLFLGFVLFTEPIVKMLFGKFSLLDIRYQSGLIILPYILLAYLFSGLYSALSVASFYANKTRELFFVSAVGLLINTICNIVLISNYGILGASISTMVTYFFMMVYIYFRSQKIYKIEFELRKIFSLFTFTLVIFFISVFLKQYLTEAYFIIISVIFLIIFLVFSKLFRVIDISAIKSILTRQA
jgi:O-antigen/teichoic acid export membrane protein